MIDVIANQPHFVDHLAPVWDALPPEARGTFYYIGPGRDRIREVEGLVRAQPHASQTPTLTASAGDLVRSRRLGRPTAIMEHGCGQSFAGDPRRGGQHGSYAGGAGRDAQLFLHPGPHPAGRDRARYPQARVEVIGCPKLDTLPRKPRSGPPVVAVAFHWECRVVLETLSAWREFARSLPALAARYEVIGHGHPRIIDQLARAYGTLGIEVVRDFEEVCRRADVYVNDASSTLFEFASTGRPVVVMNPSYYRRNVHHGLRFWEAASVGVNVDSAGVNGHAENAEKLLQAVADALSDPEPQRMAREAALSLVYAYRTGAAGRAADVLMDWAA